MKFLGLALALVFLSVSATAQTANDLNSKYGAAPDSYEVRPGVFATVKFAADGRACEMSIERRHVHGSGTIGVDPTFMSPDETKPIVEELVPLNQRGKETDFSKHIIVSGPSITTTYNYENVRITYYGHLLKSDRRSMVTSGTAAVVIQWQNRGCN